MRMRNDGEMFEVASLYERDTILAKMCVLM